MAILTKNSKQNKRTSRKQQYCFGMQEHHEHNFTGSRRKFGEIKSFGTKEKTKKYGTTK